MRGTGAGPWEPQALAAALEHNQTVEEIALRANNIGDRGIKAGRMGGGVGR